ncbi:hypothetical protein LTS18_014697 [Coniosporium uncinatum]|uniref:Uncharacterized protein n=1 Tax=Coniosporium uncinatum TaxID=93489 RepID=A0ACC3CVN2_9PEZI|nr:hypothetical protein LTS18_014697 [Coniosporium uncinatum]
MPLPTIQRLKTALWSSLATLTNSETLRLSTNATPQFILALTELVFAQILSTGKDLENFAKHAGRSTITVADVMLLARRNEGLEAVMRGFLGELREERDAELGAEVGRGTGRGRGRGRGKMGGRGRGRR